MKEPMSEAWSGRPGLSEEWEVKVEMMKNHNEGNDEQWRAGRRGNGVSNENHGEVMENEDEKYNVKDNEKMMKKIIKWRAWLWAWVVK